MLRPLAAAWLVLVAPLVPAAELPVFDLRPPSAAAQWSAAHDVGPLQPSADGLVIPITGADPYVHGPARDFPPGQALWMDVRIRSASGGGAQVFWYSGGGPAEENSVRFHVPAGAWSTLSVPLPALGPGTRLRFDPPGTRGDCVLQSVAFRARTLPTPPEWPVPPAFEARANDLVLSNGPLEIRHARTGPGAFRVSVSGRPTAVGHARNLVGYSTATGTRWFTLTPSGGRDAFGSGTVPGGFRTAARIRDPDGGTWDWMQEFRAAADGTAEVVTTVVVDTDRDVLSLPLFALFPGAGSFGGHKSQALLAGVEYLADEESSSERDLVGPQARRLVPDSLKLAFPLAAIAAEGRWLAMEWQPGPDTCVLHDSPDRTYRSGGHAWAVLFPGADPSTREDGAALPYGGRRLRAGERVASRVTLSGGPGNTVVPAVRGHVARRGLPALPATGLSDTDTFRLAAHGWLDSRIREGALYRHAVGDGFRAGPAADAAVHELWLAGRVQDGGLAERLKAAAAQALEAVPAGRRNASQVGHVRQPLPALVAREAPAAAVAAADACRHHLSLMRPDGTVPFRGSGGNARLGSTHWEDHASGLTGAHLVAALEQALESGDRGLVDECVGRLRRLVAYRDGVPRGAQTWEVPLHTPDILASAHLAKAYTLAYEATGEGAFLEQAVHWAWTGVPFVYLVQPTPGRVGVYSTTPVLGATQFIAPNWIGLPVQWCGLVYADAIRRLAPHDPSGPWARLADGIALAGIQHTHRADEPAFQGCLPDSFDLRAQARNPVPINPGTLLPPAVQALGFPALFDEAFLPRHRAWVMAPGPVRPGGETERSARFRVEGWPRGRYQVLVGGCTARPRIHVDGRDESDAAFHRFDAVPGRLFLELEGTADVELAWPEGR